LMSSLQECHPECLLAFPSAGTRALPTSELEDKIGRMQA